MLDDRRATPCEAHDDGRDYVKTNKWIVFGHHFAAISGPGPLVGPVLAAQFGYLPCAIWILIGVVLGGAVQDFVILFCSMRRDGKSLGQMVKEELNNTAGAVGLLAILSIMIILLAVLALVVVRALAESPWGIFTVGATIPIALFMGGYLRFFRVGKVLEASVIGVVLLLLAVWGGKFIHADPALAAIFTLKEEPIAWVVLVYGLAASILPVWLLLAPRDYLSTFMKLGTIFALVVGVLFALPPLKMPALTRFVDGSGLIVAGKLFPFCFITIACGALSGFHTLISSGTTPKIITREGYSRPIGYGAMCLESLVAIMALIAACTLQPGVYLSMNVKGAGADLPAITADTIQKVQSAGFTITQSEMEKLARDVGEKTLFGRTGGAATLAVGMATIFSKALTGRWIDLWYHFAIMFEALFILTTLDAGTRVGRYLLQDALGHIWKPLGETKNASASFVSSLLMVAAWGYFLIQGVRDPLGGINSLWLLFGIANQLLASIALCLATTIILKMHLQANTRYRRPAFALITFIPLIWLLAVTLTAGVQKIFHSNPRIGFLSQAKVFEQKRPKLQSALDVARKNGTKEAIALAEKPVKDNAAMIFNQYLDAAIAGIFLVMVGIIVLLSIKEWLQLLLNQRIAELRETPPIWLPDYAVREGREGAGLSFLTLAFLLARELSGEAALARAQKQTEVANTIICPDRCVHSSSGAVDELLPTNSLHTKPAGDLYAQLLEDKFRKGVNRCC